MAMPSPVLNALDHIRGVICKVEVMAWASGAIGTTTFTGTDLGETKGLTVDTKASEKLTQPDNALWPTDAWLSDFSASVSFEISQMDLVKFAHAQSELAARAIANSTTDTSYPIGASTTTGTFLRLKISFPTSRTPGVTPGSYTYTWREIYLHKCLQEPGSTLKFTREDQVFYKFNLHVLKDTSIAPVYAPGTTFIDPVGEIVDYVS